MQAKLIISFTQLSDPDFLARAEGISAALASNPAFPAPWPAQVPSPAQLSTDVGNYVFAYNAAKTGDRLRIEQRMAARNLVTADLKKLAPYLEVVAAGDTALLLSTGYELRRETAKASSANLSILPAPEDFKLARGVLSGYVTVHARKLEGAGSYEVQTTLADPTVETNWSGMGTFMRCSKIELTGLAPGKTVSVRLRAIGSHSPGAWTPAASLMVV